MTDNASVTAVRYPQSFSRKRIDVTFMIENGSLGPSGTTDTLTLTGHRCQVDVTNAGMKFGSALALRIEGVPLETMNRLSVLPAPILPRDPSIWVLGRSRVQVQAGDDVSGMSSVFYGDVSEAFIDFAGSPNVAISVSGSASFKANAKSIPAASYKGAVNVATVLSDICAQAGMTFVDRGVTETLNNYYGHGSVLQQIDRVCRAVGCSYSIDGGPIDPDTKQPTGVQARLRVWSRRYGEVNVATIPRITAQTGLIGYPAYSQQGVKFDSLFNPNIEFWEPVYIESQYTPAAWLSQDARFQQQTATNDEDLKMASSGYWLPSMVTHSLSSEIPGGPWFTHVEATALAAKNVTV